MANIKVMVINNLSKWIAFCTLIYLEIISIILLLYLVWNICTETKNIFGDYVQVSSENDIVLANKNDNNAVVLKGMLIETGMVGLDENGDIEKVYFIIELKDANILFGVEERFLSDYDANAINLIYANIIDASFSDTGIISRVEIDMNLNKRIITEFELIEYSIYEMRLTLYIVAIIVLVIGVEAIIRGRKEFRRIGWR